MHCQRRMAQDILELPAHHEMTGESVTQDMARHPFRKLNRGALRAMVEGRYARSKRPAGLPVGPKLFGQLSLNKHMADLARL